MTPLELLDKEPWEITVLMHCAAAGAKEDKRLHEKAVADAKKGR